MGEPALLRASAGSARVPPKAASLAPQLVAEGSASLAIPPPAGVAPARKLSFLAGLEAQVREQRASAAATRAQDVRADLALLARLAAERAADVERAALKREKVRKELMAAWAAQIVEKGAAVAL